MARGADIDLTQRPCTEPTAIHLKAPARTRTRTRTRTSTSKAIVSLIAESNAAPGCLGFVGLLANHVGFKIESMMLIVTSRLDAVLVHATVPFLPRRAPGDPMFATAMGTCSLA